jgi:hypothetical protein
MKTLGAREKSNAMRENDNTNRSCRKKKLNPGKITAPQLRSSTPGTQFTK